MGQVTTRHKGDMLFEIEAGSHTLLGDVPERAGGKGRGLTGTELLAAALSSCVAAMVVYSAGRAGVDVTDMSVDVTYEWAANPLRLADLKVAIHLPRCTDEARRKAILAAARQCPVHQTITSLGAIDFEVVD